MLYDSGGIVFSAANSKVHDGFLTERLMFQFAGDATLVHDKDTVTDAENFLHVA